MAERAMPLGSGADGRPFAGGARATAESRPAGVWVSARKSLTTTAAVAMSERKILTKCVAPEYKLFKIVRTASVPRR